MAAVICRATGFCSGDKPFMSGSSVEEPEPALRVYTATARFSFLKYCPITRFTSLAVTAWIRAPAVLTSCQSPKPSLKMSWKRIGVLAESLRYSAAAKLFFTFCNSSAGTSSVLSRSSSFSMAFSTSSVVCPSFTSAEISKAPAHLRESC